MFSLLIFVILFVLVVGCTKKEVTLQEAVQPWYGIAYYRADSRIGICYPIPLNIPMYYLYKLWWYLRSPKFILDSMYKEIKYAEEKRKKETDWDDRTAY